MIKRMNKKFVIVFGIILAVVLVILNLVVKEEKIPFILKTTPTNNQPDVSESSQIDIEFNSDIEEESKNKVSVIFTPQIEFDQVWLTNTLKIIPKVRLTNNTTYEVSVRYNSNEIGKFSFATQFFTQEDVEKYGALQSEDDYLYGQELIKLTEKYPFYTSLPIKTNNYVVYYDFDEDKFAITFLVRITSPEMEDELTLKAIEDIKKLGVEDPTNYYTTKSVE